MRIISCKQGSPEWLQARLGVVTASNLDQILTPGGKLSTSSSKYLARLTAEWFTGKPIDAESSKFMERGTQLEPDAVSAWEFETGMSATEVGFCVRDDGLIGCSPDRLVGEDGGLEIKVPSMQRHLEYYFDPLLLEEEYRMQVQGNLLVTERAWWEIVSWNPVLPMVRRRVLPDGKFHGQIGDAVTMFLERFAVAKAKLQDLKDLQEVMQREREDGSHPF